MWKNKPLSVILFAIVILTIHTAWTWNSASWSTGTFGVAKNNRVFETHDTNLDSFQSKRIEDNLYDSSIRKMINSFNTVRIASHNIAKARSLGYYQ